jgi:hypothetical protein
MENIKVRSKKIIKDLNTIESEYLLKSEKLKSIENQFIEAVNSFLNGYPHIKSEFDKVIDRKFENILEIKKDKKEETHKTPTETTVDVKVNKIKKLFRKIAKKTHPDKIVDEKLNNIYVRATHFYNTLDTLGTYFICDELDITYEMDEEDYNLILNKIKVLKNKIKFIESTLSWRWYSEEDKNLKLKIILNYIKTQFN